MSYYPRDRRLNLRMLLCKLIGDACGGMCSDILCSFGILRSDSTSKTDSMRCARDQHWINFHRGGGGGCVEMNHSTTWSTIPFVLRANSLMQSAQLRKDEILCLSVRFRIENSVSIALRKNRTPAAPRWGKENSGGRRGVCKGTSLVCIGLVFMGKCRYFIHFYK